MDIQCLCLGSANIDMVASVTRNPRTDEKVKIQDISQYYGGSAANTATCLARLGVRTAMVARVGNDHNGDLIITRLEHEGVITDHVIRSKGKSGYTFIGLEPGGMRVIYDYKGTNALLDPRDVPPVAADVHVVFVAGIDERGIAFAKDAFQRARYSIFAPSGYMIKEGIEPLLEGSDLLILNEYEWELVQKVSPGFTGDVVITKGAEGALAIIDGEEVQVPAFKVEPVDTTGAGDAFCGGFIYGLVQDLSIAERLRLGCATAAMNTRGYGARGGMPILEDLDKFLEENR
jgi:sugar/nucleoside kinase (ribokinase family)